MLTDKAKIEQLENKVAKLEKQMLFVIEMIGSPDAESYERGLKEEMEKSIEVLKAKSENRTLKILINCILIISFVLTASCTKEAITGPEIIYKHPVKPDRVLPESIPPLILLKLK